MVAPTTRRSALALLAVGTLVERVEVRHTFTGPDGAMAAQRKS
jgi:hypothetical protein